MKMLALIKKKWTGNFNYIYFYKSEENRFQVILVDTMVKISSWLTVEMDLESGWIWFH